VEVSKKSFGSEVKTLKILIRQIGEEVSTSREGNGNTESSHPDKREKDLLGEVVSGPKITSIIRDREEKKSEKMIRKVVGLKYG